MQDAAARLVGVHDFAAFAAGVSGERKVRRAVWDARDGVLRFEIEATAFLRGMVRGIVATLLWTGRGKISADRFEEILKSRDRAQAGPSAPAQGLCLINVSYGTEKQSEQNDGEQHSDLGESENDE
jgi:tRNA pseudouridine38-40 synthase